MPMPTLTPTPPLRSAHAQVDYLLGMAREALEADEFNRARELVAEAKIEASGAPGDDESFSQLQQLANEIEMAALNSDFPY